MLAQVLRTTLNLLLFRAGPQDFPHAPALTPWLLPPAILAQVSIFAVTVDLVHALAMGAVVIGALALCTRAMLALRGLGSRYLQTFHAQLVSLTVIALLLRIPFAQLAPIWIELLQLPPEVLQQQLPVQPPAGPAMLMNLLVLWSFAVMVNIARHALDVRLIPALLVTVFYGFGMMFMVTFGGALVSLILGPGTLAGAEPPLG